LQEKQQRPASCFREKTRPTAAANQLTPDQLAEGQKRATELFEKISGGK
jgi:hypothetical protein